MSLIAAQLDEAFRAFAAKQSFDFEPRSLYAPIRYAMAKPGKYVRPLLLLQAYRLAHQDISPALPAAFAVELFHNFTLVHDDIMDVAELRRGRPTVHLAFSEPTAILAGDAMLIHAYDYLLQHYPDEVGMRALQCFSAMAKALCQGQQRDMDMEQSLDQRQRYEDYVGMIAGKTGALITASLELGGIIAGLNDEQLDHLRRGGDLAGQAFQILDDTLDTFSDSGSTGKMEQGDIQRGKLSAPYFIALDQASAHDADRLQHIYRLPVEQRQPLVPEVLALFAQHRVEEALREEARTLTAAARAEFAAVGGDAAALASLLELVDGLLHRKF